MITLARLGICLLAVLTSAPAFPQLRPPPTPTPPASYLLNIQSSELHEDSGTLEPASLPVLPVSELSTLGERVAQARVSNTTSIPTSPFFVDVLGQSTGGLGLGALASLNYYFQVRPIGSPSAELLSSIVPVTMRSLLHASGFADGAASFSRATLDLNSSGFAIPGLSLHFQAVTGCMFGGDCPTQDLSIEETINVEVNSLIQVQLSANGQAGLPSVFPNASGRSGFQATADPTFEIATGFVLRDFFTLEFSENLPVTAAIPEPETYAMLLAGLGLLGFAARRRKMKAAATA